MCKGKISLLKNKVDNKRLYFHIILCNGKSEIKYKNELKKEYSGIIFLRIFNQIINLCDSTIKTDRHSDRQTDGRTLLVRV